MLRQPKETTTDNPDQCPRKEDGNWHDIQGVGCTHGYQRSMSKGEMLLMWRNGTLQTGQSKEAQDEGGSITTLQFLLGSCSNEQENGLEDRGGKRQGRAVNDSTDSAKNLVSSGTHSLPASQAHCTSVVINAHSNIPTTFCDLTTETETKEESKQADRAADPGTVQPAKHPASNSL